MEDLLESMNPSSFNNDINYIKRVELINLQRIYKKKKSFIKYKQLFWLN
jgi:hypothetical protein